MISIKDLSFHLNDIRLVCPSVPCDRFILQLWEFHPLSVCWPFQERESPSPMLDQSQMHPCRRLIQHMWLFQQQQPPLPNGSPFWQFIGPKSPVSPFPRVRLISCGRQKMSLLPNIGMAIVTDFINKWFGTWWFCHYCQNVTHGVVTVGGHICTAIILSRVGTIQDSKNWFQIQVLAWFWIRIAIH